MRWASPTNVQLTGATLNKHFVTEICPDRKTHRSLPCGDKPIPFIKVGRRKKVKWGKIYHHITLKSCKAKDRQTIPQALVAHAFLSFLPLLGFL